MPLWQCMLLLWQWKFVELTLSEDEWNFQSWSHEIDIQVEVEKHPATKNCNFSELAGYFTTSFVLLFSRVDCITAAHFIEILLIYIEIASVSSDLKALYIIIIIIIKWQDLKYKVQF